MRVSGLFARVTEKYLAGESTSVKTETAEELLRSVVFTLSMALKAEGRPESALLTDDLERLMEAGRGEIRKKAAAARELWKQACLTAPEIKNVYYTQSLKEAGAFFGRYDTVYFAHLIPCSIDYPLCIPVQESGQGVVYIERWLTGMLTENFILSRLDAGGVRRVLEKVSEDYCDYPMNLTEQPAVNALGLALIGKTGASPVITDSDRPRIVDALRRCGEIEKELAGAAALVSARLFSGRRDAAEYMSAIAAGVCPRLAVSLDASGLDRVFL